MNPTNSELKACPAPYVVGKAIESIEAQVRNGATTVHLTNECAQAVLTALRTRKSEALADDAVSVSGLLDWIEQAWPEGSGSGFNQGVVRGFEIIRAQLQEGHIQRYCATRSPAPAADALADENCGSDTLTHRQHVFEDRRYSNELVGNMVRANAEMFLTTLRTAAPAPLRAENERLLREARAFIGTTRIPYSWASRETERQALLIRIDAAIKEAK